MFNLTVIGCVIFPQGHHGGALRLRLRPGHPVHGRQGPAPLAAGVVGGASARTRPVGGVQRRGAPGGAAATAAQPARAGLLPAGAVPHGPVHMEEAPL